MGTEAASARQKILKVVIQLLYKDSPETITTRQIAAEAGVNVAAINYYFHTKEKLIDEAVLAETGTAFQSGLALLRNKELAPTERIEKFFKGYATRLVEFQGFTRTAFMGFLLRRGGSERYVEYFKDLLDAVVGVLGEVGPDGDIRTCKDKAMALFAGVVFPFLLVGRRSSIGAANYSDPVERNRYIECLVKALGS